MKTYKCQKCGLEYERKIWAEKCEEFCRKNNACSLDITKHSINKEENKNKK